MELKAPLPGPPWDDLSARLSRLARRQARPKAERRAAAVLVPLFVREGALHTVFIRRPESARAHAGQIAFAGGRIEPGEDARTAALREAEEELGLHRDLAVPLGALHDVDTTTGFVMTPWVAAIPDGVVWTPSDAEVARVFTAPLEGLAKVRDTVTLERDGRTYTTPLYPWDGETIWGATGRVVSDLLALLAGP